MGTHNARGPERVSVSRLLGVVVDPQSYKNILYLLLAFPLGLAYFVALTVGLALGMALAFFVIGIVILIALIVGSRVLAAFERELANALLDTTIQGPTDVSSPSTSGLWPALKAYLGAASTWKGLAFLYVKFWMGVFAFVVLVVAYSLALAFLTAPLHYDDPTVVITGLWTIETLGEALIAVPIGAALLVIAFHLANGLAWIAGMIADGLLGGEGVEEMAS